MNLHGVKGAIYIEDEFFEEQKNLRTYSMESRILGETFHYAELIVYSYSEVQEILKWCAKNFGYPGWCADTRKTVWDYTTDPNRFWFSDEKNLMLFVLCWS